MQFEKCRVATYSATFLLIAFITTDVFSASRALVRFTYKFHSELLLPEFQNAYIQRLNLELNLICPSENQVNLYSFEENPYKLIQEINKQFRTRMTLCSQGQYNLNKIDSLIDLKQSLSNFTKNRYIIFASESTLRMESSLGHIAILYLEPDNPFFSPTISFSADSIQEIAKPITSIEYYFKGGFSHLDGEVRINYFFDHYWDLVKQDGRQLEKYKIINNKQNSLANFDIQVLKSIGKRKPYNFFSENCSTILFNMLLEAKEEPVRVAGFEAPAKHLTQLVRLGQIKYESTIRQKSKALNLNYFDKNHLKNSNIYPSYLEVLNNIDHTNISIFLYEENRPWSGYQEKYGTSKIGGIKYEQEDDNGRLTLIEKSTIQNFNTGGLSSFLGANYRNSLSAYYYAGYGLYSNGAGATTSIGCNTKRGCGVLTSFIYSHSTYDLQLNYLADKTDNKISLRYFLQLSQRLGLNLKYQPKESWLGLKIKF